MHGWWWSGRQIVPILPVMAILFATAVDQNRRRLQLVVVGNASWHFFVAVARRKPPLASTPLSSTLNAQPTRSIDSGA